MHKKYSKPIQYRVQNCTFWTLINEALYGRKCRTPVCWTELNEHKVIGPDIVKDTEEKVQVIQKRLKAASD